MLFLKNISIPKIDIHGHIGQWAEDKCNGDSYCSLSELLDLVYEEDILRVLISSLSGIYPFKNYMGDHPQLDQSAANEEIIREAARNKRCLPLAVCQPGFAKPEDLAVQLANDKFYGLKFHPFCLKRNADDPIYDDYLRLAQKYALPCVIHSGVYLDITIKETSPSDPARIYELAKRFPEVPVVLYHMSLWGPKEPVFELVQRGLDKKEANLYLDTAGCTPEEVLAAVKAVGAERIMFGTDVPIRGYAHYDSYEPMLQMMNERLTYEQRYKIFYENARDLFRINLGN